MNQTAIDPVASATAIQVLILEPNEQVSAEIQSALNEAAPGTTSTVARSLGEAQQLVINQKPTLFVLDVDAAYNLGQEFIYDLRTSHPNARAIILTATHFTAHRDQAAGLGVIHFLEKPFPRNDFITLVEALLSPPGRSEGQRFAGTLSDLHIADIVQLKCISGATSMLEFTGPRGEKAQVYFDNGQVRHAVSPGKEGLEAFNEIVGWKGGVISERAMPLDAPKTIDLDWQVLLMEAVRNIDETRGAASAAAPEKSQTEQQKILVIDDSVMLLSFVKEILSEHRYQVETAPTASEGLESCRSFLPDLILLDYVLPDMKGDEVCRRLLKEGTTAKVPVVYMSGFGSDLQAHHAELPNVIGALNKPFTSDSLLTSVRSYLSSKEPASTAATELPVALEQISVDPEPSVEMRESSPFPAEQKADVKDETGTAADSSFSPPAEPLAAIPSLSKDADQTASTTKPLVQDLDRSSNVSEPDIAPASDAPSTQQSLQADTHQQLTTDTAEVSETNPSSPIETPASANEKITSLPDQLGVGQTSPDSPSEAQVPSPAVESSTFSELPGGIAYFCGDSSFFSLHWALQTIEREKLTGSLRAFWPQESVELLARDGKVVLVTTRDPNLYCEEAPVTLLNVDATRVQEAKTRQTSDGCPLFVTLAKEGLILREPALQLVQHYGQKLFSQLWTADRVRFVFEQQPLPDYTRDLTSAEESIDQWALSTLRFVQYQKLGNKAVVEATCIPAYTRDGYERVQHLRLTVAEAQFASQFNGSRSMAQIAKNLRLDVKFARLTLFRFLALEIVDCWPAQLGEERSARSGLRGIFSR